MNKMNYEDRMEVVLALKAVIVSIPDVYKDTAVALAATKASVGLEQVEKDLSYWLVEFTARVGLIYLALTDLEDFDHPYDERSVDIAMDSAREILAHQKTHEDLINQVKSQFIAPD